LKRIVWPLIAIGAVLLTTWWLSLNTDYLGREYDWGIAATLPRPDIPADNPMSEAKVELGRRLFYDTRLSVNGSTACGTCHVQGKAFTDGLPRSVGATGERHPRGAMSLVNVGYASRLTWANPLLDRLEDQALTPMFGDDPVEMGLAGRESLITDLLRSDEIYANTFPKVYPHDADPYSVLNTVRSIAAFVRSIVSFDSAYDRFLGGDLDSLDASAERGMELFFSERLECFHCHGGFNFTDSTTHANSNVERVGFHNNGLYNIGDSGAYPADNTGLFDMTGERRDMGRFKAPSLRNVAVTAPYMHDGSIATLDDVIRHYERGGRLIEEAPLAGDGRLSPYKSEFVLGFELSPAERADLLAFLHSLTDQTVLTSERWQDPFVAE
jgi:cytochrome c peroxidase